MTSGSVWGLAKGNRYASMWGSAPHLLAMEKNMCWSSLRVGGRSSGMTLLMTTAHRRCSSSSVKVELSKLKTTLSFSRFNRPSWARGADVTKDATLHPEKPHTRPLFQHLRTGYYTIEAPHNFKKWNRSRWCRAYTRHQLDAFRFKRLWNGDGRGDGKRRKRPSLYGPVHFPSTGPWVPHLFP